MSKYSVDKIPSEWLIESADHHKMLRKCAKLSQLDLALRSGVSLASVKRFEQTGQIALESFLKLIYVLDRLNDFETVLFISQDLSQVERLFSKKTRSPKL